MLTKHESPLDPAVGQTFDDRVYIVAIQLYCLVWQLDPG